MMRGNYSGTPTHCVTILQGIKDKMPNAQVDYIQGCDIEKDYLQFPKMHLVNGNGKKGFYAEYYASTDWTGETVRTENLTEINFMTDGGYGFGAGVPSSDFTARYTGKFTSDFDGQLCFSMNGTSYTVKVNGKTIGEFYPKPLSFKFVPGMELTDEQRKELMSSGLFRWRGGDDFITDVKAGETYDIEILYKSAAAGSSSRLNIDMVERRTTEVDQINH